MRESGELLQSARLAYPAGSMTMVAMYPREFLHEYVLPAIGCQRDHPLQKHLAANAISQMDNLAEVVAAHVLPAGRTGLRRGEAAEYRQALRGR